MLNRENLPHNLNYIKHSQAYDFLSLSQTCNTKSINFARMKPRDNQMYYISDRTNLVQNDKELRKQITEPFHMFDRQIALKRCQSGKRFETGVLVGLGSEETKEMYGFL